MYYNFSHLSKTSLSIAIAIISVILSVVFFAIGFNYEGNVLAGFILLAVGCLIASANSILTFVKCRKFGNENAKKAEPPKNLKNKDLFKTLTTIGAILTIIVVLLFVVGVIVMLA